MKVRLLLVVALAVIAGCGDNRDAKSVTQSSDEKTALLGLPCVEAPGKAELLNEKGELALFAGETAEDSTFNKAGREEICTAASVKPSSQFANYEHHRLRPD